MDLMIHGTGTSAKLVYSELKVANDYNVVGFTCDDEFYSDDNFLGHKVYRLADIKKVFSVTSTKIISLGSYGSARSRHNSYLNVKQMGFQFINFISKNANVKDDLIIGENNVVFGGVYLDYFGEIGNNNIIRPNTYIGHNFKIGDGNYIAPSCNIAGYVAINNLAFIGIGTTVIERINIAAETIIGAASLIVRDTEPNGKYMGIPGKKTN